MKINSGNIYHGLRFNLVEKKEQVKNHDFHQEGCIKVC